MFNQALLKRLAAEIKAQPCTDEQKADETYMADIKDILAVLELSPFILFNSIELMNKERIKIKKYQKAELTRDPVIDLIIADYDDYMEYFKKIALPVPKVVTDQYDTLNKCKDSVIKALIKYQGIESKLTAEQPEEPVEEKSPIILLS